MTLVDCRGMKCPMPVIQVRLHLNTLKKDDELMIAADDPTFRDEFLRFCNLADIKCLSIQDNPDHTVYHAKLLI